MKQATSPCVVLIIKLYHVHLVRRCCLLLHMSKRSVVCVSFVIIIELHDFTA